MVAKYKKNKRRLSKNLIFHAGLAIIILLLIGFLTNANIKLSEKRTEFRSEAEILKRELQDLKDQKEFIDTRISWSTEEEYLEEIARDTRNLMKEGEKAVVIMPLSDEVEDPEKKEAKSFLENILNWIK